MTTFTTAQHAAWLQLQVALAAKFARVRADIRREDEREAASIHVRGSDRWLEVRDEESGPEADLEEECHDD